MSAREDFEKILYDRVAAHFSNEGDEFDEENQTIAKIASMLGLNWAAEQPVGLFAAAEDDSKAARREHRRRMADCHSACVEYIKANWPKGFLFWLLSAIFWHVIVILVGRWIMKEFFTDPKLPEEICQPNPVGMAWLV